MPYATIGEYITRLCKLGFHPIPLDPYSKVTHAHGWADPKDNTPDRFFAAASAHYGTPCDPTMPVEQWFATHGRNVGNLNAPSRVLVLDIDDPAALDAINAALKAISGKPIGYANLNKSTWARWQSVRGRKYAWRVPADTEGVRLAVRNKGKFRGICEFRTSGQDVLPYSVRGDAGGTILAWDQPDGLIPEGVKTIPKVPASIVAAMNALRENANAMRAAHVAAGGDPGAWGMDPSGGKRYPPLLAARVEERQYANRVGLADTLASYGYVQRGARWAPEGSRHADGIIVDADDRTGYCFHESEPISGMLDPWRLFVELGHGGDLRAACDAINTLRGVKRAPGVSDHTPGASHAHIPQPVGGATPGITDDAEGDTTGQGRPSEVPRDDFGAADMLSVIGTDFVAKDFRFRGILNLTPGLYILAAKPKAGKSFLAMGMAFAAATGEDYAGTRGGPMEGLYIAVDEQDESRPKKRAELWLQGRPAPQALRNVRVVHAWPRGDAGLTRLGEYLDAHPACGFVVIDTYVAWREQGEAADKRGVYQAEYDEVAALGQFAYARRIVVLLVHHLRKGKIDPDDPFDSISGTNGVQGATDGNIVMMRTSSEDSNDAAHAMLWARTRDYEETDAHIAFEGGRWVHKGPAWTARHAGTQAAIIECMRQDITREYTSTEVYAHLKEYGVDCGSRQNVANVMHRMGKLGSLIPPRTRGGAGGTGGYRLPSQLAEKPGGAESVV